MMNSKIESQLLGKQHVHICVRKFTVSEDISLQLFKKVEDVQLASLYESDDGAYIYMNKGDLVSYELLNMVNFEGKILRSYKILISRSGSILEETYTGWCTQSLGNFVNSIDIQHEHLTNFFEDTFLIKSSVSC